MTSLFTQCPHCQTSFRVSNAQLNAAHGLVRCGSCLGVFSASANEIRVKHPDGYVVEELETAQAAAAMDEIDEIDEVEAESLSAEAVIWHRPGEPHFTFGDLSIDELDNDYETEHQVELTAGAYKAAPIDAAPPSPEPGEPVVAPFVEEHEADEPAASAPMSSADNVSAEKQALHARLGKLSFDDALDPVSAADLQGLDAVPVLLVHRSRFHSRVVTGLLMGANLLLLLALPLPWLYTHRNELATHPRFSFLAGPVCHYLVCALPQITVPATLYSQQLLIRSHPKAPEALEVSFVFHNDAKQPENFPQLELAFSDINNHVLANRLFTPDEYLPPELRQLHQMPAQSSMQIQLELADPGKAAVNYKVELYPL